jgi:hypothetical protein
MATLRHSRIALTMEIYTQVPNLLIRRSGHIEKKRQELSRTVDTALEVLAELNEDEAHLGEEETKLDPLTVVTLDALLQPSATPKYMDMFLASMPTLGPIPTRQIAEIIVQTAAHVKVGSRPR